MPDAIFVCKAHGYHEGERCPVCGELGQQVLDGNRRRRLSKFVSGALRHFPEDAGIGLDDGGWTQFDELDAAVQRKYDWVTIEQLEGVLATDPKGRFEVSETADDSDSRRVRAAYGHSVDVTLDAAETLAPDRLYHGTAPRNLQSIMAEGLQPMGRQQVHLSETVADAREVGARHADDPVILEVDAARMQGDGYEIVKRGTGTYTTDEVPPEYLTQR